MLQSETGYWWSVSEQTGELDVRVCPFGLCPGGNTCGENREWGSMMCTQCVEGTMAWGRECVECSGWNYLSIVGRWLCIVVYVAVVHHSSSGNSSAVRIFMQQLEVLSLIIELRTFFRLASTQGGGELLLQSTFLFATGVVSQGVAVVSCIGPMSSLWALLYPMIHMIALGAAVPLVTYMFRRTISVSCWRQTGCALMLLFVQMSSRQFFQSITCVSGVNAYHPNVTCHSTLSDTVTLIYLASFVASVLSIVSLAVYVVSSTRARRHPWPVLFGTFRWHTPLTRWWLVVVTSRRVLFVVAYVCAAATDDPALAVAAMSMIAMSSAVAQHTVRPFVHKMDNLSDLASQLGILILVQFVEASVAVFGVVAVLSMAIPASFASRQVARKIKNLVTKIKTRTKVVTCFLSRHRRRLLRCGRGGNTKSSNSNSNSTAEPSSMLTIDDAFVESETNRELV
eukprot:PhM_4_TR3409/c1_g4_i2/m.29764